MILNEIFKKPIFSFGLGKLTALIQVGQTVRVYNNEIFNENVFELINDSDVKSNTQFFDLDCNELGTFVIAPVIKNTITNFEQSGNVIDLNVKFRADNTYITADTNLITSDYE
jgi:hypothetical protein